MIQKWVQPAVQKWDGRVSQKRLVGGFKNCGRCQCQMATRLPACLHSRKSVFFACVFISAFRKRTIQAGVLVDLIIRRNQSAQPRSCDPPEPKWLRPTATPCRVLVVAGASTRHNISGNIFLSLGCNFFQCYLHAFCRFQNFPSIWPEPDVFEAPENL